jgi:hypothetical protein
MIFFIMFVLPFYIFYFLFLIKAVPMAITAMIAIGDATELQPFFSATVGSVASGVSVPTGLGVASESVTSGSVTSGVVMGSVVASGSAVVSSDLV